MNAVPVSEEDSIGEQPLHKIGRTNRPAKRTTKDLTCTEADVDELLSAGEIT